MLRSWVPAIAFSPDGKTLASASDDGTVRLWNPITRKQLGRLSGHTGGVAAVTFSPDGKTPGSASGDRTIRIWNRATRTRLARLGTNHYLADVRSAPTGNIVAASGDKTVHIWNKIVWHNTIELQATVCDAVTGLGRREWSQYAPGIPYRRSCP